MHQNERHEMFDAVKGLIDTWIDPTRHVSDLRPHLQKLHNMIYPKPDEVLDADPSKPPSQLHPEPVVSVKKGEHGVPVVTRSPSPLTGDPDEWTMGGGPPAAGPNTKVPIALLEVDEDGVLRGSSRPLPGGIDDA